MRETSAGDSAKQTEVTKTSNASDWGAKGWRIPFLTVSHKNTMTTTCVTPAKLTSGNMALTLSDVKMALLTCAGSLKNLVIKIFRLFGLPVCS